MMQFFHYTFNFLDIDLVLWDFYKGYGMFIHGVIFYGLLCFCLLIYCSIYTYYYGNNHWHFLFLI